MNPLTLEVLLQVPNKVLDFGAPLAYPEICPAYTVERFTMWERIEEHIFEIIVVKAREMPKARLEGTLYNLSDEQLIKLDKYRGNGVQCDRKFLPAYVPLNDADGNMTKVLAWIYVGRNDVWIDRITYGSSVPKNPTFRLPDTVPDASKLLHNRRVFLPRPHNYGQIGEISEAMRKHVRKRNRSEMRRLNFERRKRQFMSFINDDE